MSSPSSAADAANQFLARVQDALRQRDVAAAQTLIRNWLEAQPGHPEALYFRAVTERLGGHFDTALNTLDQLLQNDPGHSRALQECGHIRRRQGDLPGALNDYQRATRLNPALLASWAAQAELLVELGHHQAAQQAGEQVAWLRQLPEPLRVVMDLVARGRLGKAEQLCKRFMHANPTHVEGMRLLADIAVRLSALDEAELLLSTAADLAPDNLRVAVDHVQLLRKQQDFAAAFEKAERLVERHPGDLRLQSLAAVEAMQVGDYPRALTRFERILESLPGDPVTLTSKGHALKTTGQTTEAIDSYRAAISSQPGYGEAWYALANLKTFTFEAEDHQRMSALLRSKQLDHNSVVFLQFALGKAYEDLGDFEQSFAHYAAGNREKRRQSTYSAARMSEEFAAQQSVCTTELFARHANAGCPADDPIFIVGLPRAGSTLLEQILASHPDVDGTLELPNVLSLVQRLRRRDADTPYPQILSTLEPEELREFGEAFIRDTQIHRQGARLFIDKMPNNFRHIGLIKLMLPNARIIDARRNPLACCFSGFKQLFAEGQEFSYDLTDIGRYYRDYVDLMEHWQSVLPGQILQVNNEDVIADLEGQVHRLLEFCGLPFDERCLRYWETERAVKTPSSEQVRRPVTDAGQHQWRNYRPWLGDLESTLGPALVGLSE